jgi:CHAD domain-containing protein
MKANKALKKYYRKRIESIDLLFNKPVEIFSVVDFHKLRVEIKKIKALFGLINYSSEDFEKKKLFSPFKSIFIQAGEVRELQLEIIELNKYAHYNGVKNYLNYLKKIEQKEKSIFFSMINKKTFNKLKKSNLIVLPFLEKINKNHTDKYINNLNKEILTIENKKNIKLSHLHKLRIQLKEFYYNCGSLNLFKHKKIIKKIDGFQNLLGKWHNFVVIKEHLKEAIEYMDTIIASEGKLLKKVKNEISNNSKIIFKKIGLALYKKRVLQHLIP